MGEVSRTYTQCDVDLNLARSVWSLIDALEHTANPPKMIGVCLWKDEDGDNTVIEYTEYNQGDEQKNEHMMAAMSVEPFTDGDDDRSADEDPELKKAMQFMYFYQAMNVTLQKFNNGLL